MSIIVSINPFDEVTTKTAFKISFHTEEIKSGATTYRVSLYDSNDVCFTHKYVTLDEQDILNCGSDDKHIFEYIMHTLGMKLL